MCAGVCEEGADGSGVAKYHEVDYVDMYSSDILQTKSDLLAPEVVTVVYCKAQVGR